MSNKLQATALQSRLLKAMGVSGDTMSFADHEVRIVDMYEYVYGDPNGLTVRDMQQKLGPLIARTNSRLKRKGKKYRVIPGKTKQTYRIKLDR